MSSTFVASSPRQLQIESNELTVVDNRAGHVTFHDGRAFIPLASRGCGVGCKYCYISHPESAVEALPVARIHDLLQAVRDRIGSPPSADRPILVIGYYTEIAMSEGVLANAMMCLEFAVKLHLPVQLATKFPLPDTLRQTFDAWPLGNPRPIVFTTITTTSLSSQLEPNAPTPGERCANFRRHGKAWYSYALVKPFFETSCGECESLLDLLAQGRPDGIVVGVRYRRARAQSAFGDAHPVANNWIAVPPSEAAQQFARRLTGMGFRVFMNTQCASAWHNASSDGLIVKQNYPHLCVNCGACV